jgi:hypothetical protein
MRRPFSVAAVVALGLLALFSGCSPRKTFAPRMAPETTVFVQGPVDTVSYHVHLYWFGSDVDGFVVAYELRFKNPSAPADTQWVRTTRTDSIFQVFTPTGSSSPIFEVRAIDNEGMVDPTPARQNFTFNNLPPRLFITGGPRSTDSTFASATVTWFASDPDGDIANAHYRVWLDGNEANPNLTTATTYTIPTQQFRQGGALLSGVRRVYVQAIDEAGYTTPPESLTWYVRAPVTGTRARLLIIDDVPGNTGPAGRNDSLYVNTATRNLPADSWSELRLEFTQPFHSALDLEQTFKLFETVIWYRGTEGSLQPILTNYRDGLAHYLDSGGKFMIESQAIVDGPGAPGIFPESWVSQYFGSDYLYLHGTAVVGDSVASWGIASGDDFGHPVILRSTVFGDSLQETQIYGELRGFAVRDTQYVAAWARSGNLTQNNANDIPVGVTVPQPSGGRLVAVSFPIRTANGFGTAARYLAKIFEQLGLTGP